MVTRYGLWNIIDTSGTPITKVGDSVHGVISVAGNTWYRPAPGTGRHLRLHFTKRNRFLPAVTTTTRTTRSRRTRCGAMSVVIPFDKARYAYAICSDCESQPFSNCTTISSPMIFSRLTCWAGPRSHARLQRKFPGVTTGPHTACGLRQIVTRPPGPGFIHLHGRGLFATHVVQCVR